MFFTVKIVYRFSFFFLAIMCSSLALVGSSESYSNLKNIICLMGDIIMMKVKGFFYCNSMNAVMCT